MSTHGLSKMFVVCVAHIFLLNRCFGGWVQVGPTSGWLGGFAFSGVSCPQFTTCFFFINSLHESSWNFGPPLAIQKMLPSHCHIFHNTYLPNLNGLFQGFQWVSQLSGGEGFKKQWLWYAPHRGGGCWDISLIDLDIKLNNSRSQNPGQLWEGTTSMCKLIIIGLRRL